MSYYFSPVGNSPWVDSNGDPLVGGYWSFFLAGTSTPVAVYTDNTGTVAQPADLTLQSNGMPFSPIWLQGGIAVKARLFTSAGVAVANGTFDNISGIDDPAIASAVDQWVPYTGAATYISATSFSVAGDQTNDFQVNRRIRSTNTGGTVYSTIRTSVFSAGLTTVTLTNTSGALDSGLSSVSYGLLSPDNPSIPANYLTIFPGLLYGMTLANNGTDPTNDIDISAGQCADSTGVMMMRNPSTLTKRLDAAWSAGNGGGWLDTGSIANTTYHAYAIQKDSDGVFDSIASASASGPLMPSGYTYFRRIGSVMRLGGSIVGFFQRGGIFTLKAGAYDINATSPGTAAVLRSLTVPTGKKLRVFGLATLGASAVGSTSHIFTDPEADDQAPNSSGAGNNLFAQTNESSSGYLECGTNTSGQIRSRNATANADVIRFTTHGWFDDRGMSA